MNRLQLVVAVLLAVIAAATGWRLLMQPDAQKADRFAGPSRPSYELIDFELDAFDTQGRLAFKARSPRLVHDEQREGLAVTTPDFVLYGVEGQTWTARALGAWIDTVAKRIDLERDVVVDRASDKPDEQFSLATERLVAYTETRLIETDREVEVTRPGSILRGRGLSADLSAQSFELKAAVDATFAAKR
jgi:lipopolysaccharide export system protein LptC